MDVCFPDDPGVEIWLTPYQFIGPLVAAPFVRRRVQRAADVRTHAAGLRDVSLEDSPASSEFSVAAAAAKYSLRWHFMSQTWEASFLAWPLRGRMAPAVLEGRCR